MRAHVVGTKEYAVSGGKPCKTRGNYANMFVNGTLDGPTQGIFDNFVAHLAVMLKIRHEVIE